MSDIVQIQSYQENETPEDLMEVDDEGLARLKLTKYTLTPEQIAEHGEEKAKQKQEFLDYLFALRVEIPRARKERKERLANATDKERYQILKEEARFAKEQALWGKQLAKQQRDGMAQSMTQHLMDKIKEAYADGKLQKEVEAPPKQGKRRHSRKGS